MRETRNRWSRKGLAVAISLTLTLTLAQAAPAVAEEAASSDEPTQTKLEELEEAIKILAEEIADMKSEEAVPDDVDPEETFSGLGPAASKVYRRDKGLSIGGYGEIRFRHFTNDSDGKASVYDALRFVLYTGYKFNDWLVMNSEVEFEHADTGNNGSVAVEFLTLDFLFKDWINARTGLLLIPMGFLNEIHEPPFYFGAERPEVERRILPSTWRENGFGIFGTIGMGDVGDLEYRMYGVNGFDSTGFDDDGLRGGRQKGSEALADHFAFVGRVDWNMSAFAPGLLLGGSVYAGKSGQNQSHTQSDDITDVNLPDSFVHIYELHAQYRGYGVSVRSLFTQAFVDDAGDLSRDLELGPFGSVAKEMIGGYAEVGYNVLQFVNTEMSLEPFFRFEHVDTQHKVASGFRKNQVRDFNLYVMGFSYKPIPQVVIKMDYREFDARRGSISDEFQASIGFVF
jgi:hypothetical protein